MDSSCGLGREWKRLDQVSEVGRVAAIPGIRDC